VHHKGKGDSEGSTHVMTACPCSNDTDTADTPRRSDTPSSIVRTHDPHVMPSTCEQRVMRARPRETSQATACDAIDVQCGDDVMIDISTTRE
jgi:hypothetical protein